MTEESKFRNSFYRLFSCTSCCRRGNSETSLEDIGIRRPPTPAPDRRQFRKTREFFRTFKKNFRRHRGESSDPALYSWAETDVAALYSWAETGVGCKESWSEDTMFGIPEISSELISEYRNFSDVSRNLSPQSRVLDEDRINRLVDTASERRDVGSSVDAVDMVERRARLFSDSAVLTTVSENPFELPSRSSSATSTTSTTRTAIDDVIERLDAETEWGMQTLWGSNGVQEPVRGREEGREKEDRRGQEEHGGQVEAGGACVVKANGLELPPGGWISKSEFLKRFLLLRRAVKLMLLLLTIFVGWLWS